MSKLALVPVATVTQQRKVLAGLGLVLSDLGEISKAFFASVGAVGLSGDTIGLVGEIIVFTNEVLEHVFGDMEI